MPFYGFGTLRVAAQYDLGALGPVEGPAIPVESPIQDALRGVFLWLVLLVLLFRKPNWNRQAWAIVLALGVVFLVLHAAESLINLYVVYHADRYASAILLDMLRFLAGALAVLLAVSDGITLRHRWGRFLPVFLILFVAGAAALLLNPPIVITFEAWLLIFGVFLLLFLVGHVLLGTLLGWLTGPRRLAWTAALTLPLGAAPLLICAGLGPLLDRSIGSGAALAVFRAAAAAQAILGPYFVLSWFLLLGLLVPFYRRRLAQAFGYPAAT